MTAESMAVSPLPIEVWVSVWSEEDQRVETMQLLSISANQQLDINIEFDVATLTAWTIAVTGMPGSLRIQ